MMNKKIIFGLCILVLFLSACATPSRKNFIYEDNHNDVENEQECFKLCKNREKTDSSSVERYFCDYESPICDGDVCLCKTLKMQPINS